MNERTRLVDELMTAHVTANLGIYFDRKIEVESTNLTVALSHKIQDFYWNYGYSSGGRHLDEGDVAAIVKAGAAFDRRPGLWQLEPELPPPGGQPASRESWMVCSADSIDKTEAEIVDSHDIQILETPSAAMRSTFDDAYGSGGSTGDVGYFELPSYYGDAYLTGAARSPATSFTVALLVNGEVAAVASASLVGRIAGIYSVGTAHAWRQRGFGKRISLECIRAAAQRGAGSFFLQTEADSIVEDMYASLGFSRMFVGCLYSTEIA